jgi:hypothetical protein
VWHRIGCGVASYATATARADFDVNFESRSTCPATSGGKLGEGGNRHIDSDELHGVKKIALRPL